MLTCISKDLPCSPPVGTGATVWLILQQPVVIFYDPSEFCRVQSGELGDMTGTALPASFKSSVSLFSSSRNAVWLPNYYLGRKGGGLRRLHLALIAIMAPPPEVRGQMGESCMPLSVSIPITH